jgi:hypothetical protein
MQVGLAALLAVAGVDPHTAPILVIPESPQGLSGTQGPSPVRLPLGPGSPLRCGRDDKFRG